MSWGTRCAKRLGDWRCDVYTRSEDGFCSHHRSRSRTRRLAALSAARDEVVRAARDLWAHATVIGHPVDEESRWMRLGTAVAALARLEGK